MKEFWEWMDLHGYGKKYTVAANKVEIFELTDRNGCQNVLPRKAMLIGYMLQYINSHEIWNDKELPFFEGELCGVETRLSMAWAHNDIYQELSEIINLFNKNIKKT
jgi:hypothetical protein